MTNIHRLKKKLKNINKGLAQHYKKRILLIQSIEALEIVKRDTRLKIQSMKKTSKTTHKPYTLGDKHK